MYQGRYTSGSLGDIIVTLLNAGKQCGYIFASDLAGLPSGYSGYVSYNSATDTTGAIPITLRDQNKFPIFGRIMLSTKIVEWNADINIDGKAIKISSSNGGTLNIEQNYVSANWNRLQVDDGGIKYLRYVNGSWTTVWSK